MFCVWKRLSRNWSRGTVFGMNNMRLASEPDFTDADFQRVRRIAQEEAGITFSGIKKHAGLFACFPPCA